MNRVFKIKIVYPKYILPKYKCVCVLERENLRQQSKKILIKNMFENDEKLMLMTHKTDIKKSYKKSVNDHKKDIEKSVF